MKTSVPNASAGPSGNLAIFGFPNQLAEEEKKKNREAKNAIPHADLFNTHPNVSESQKKLVPTETMSAMVFSAWKFGERKQFHHEANQMWNQ